MTAALALRAVTVGARGSRNSTERRAATKAEVPVGFDQGYGRRQYDKWGWCGFGLGCYGPDANLLTRSSLAAARVLGAAAEGTSD